MMKKRSMFSVTLAVILVFSLALTGCSGGSAPSSGGGNANPNQKVDLTELAKSFAPEMSAEDAEIWKDIEALSSNPDKITWRHGNVVRSMDESPSTRGDRQFFIELKKRLGDKVEFQFYMNGTLGTTADQILGGLQNKNFESQAYNVGAFAEYTKAFMPLDVMFLIPDLESAFKVVNGEPGKLMREKCIEDSGLKVLLMGAIGMRHITNSKKPIHNTDDIKGLKIRTQNNPLHIIAAQSWGAAPTPIAFAELFTALQQKTVDGQENPIANIFEQNYLEVQKYMTLTNHLYTAGATVVNNEWYEALPSDVKQAIAEAQEIAQKYSEDDLKSCEAKMLEHLKTGMEITELSDEASAKFKEMSMTTWNEAADKIGKDYFDKVRASIEKTLA